MMKYILIVLLVSGCATLGNKYVGQSYYYTASDGVEWECRPPAAYPGGNCKPETEWEKPS